MSVGTAMFYYLSSYISEDTKYYPPTRQFFSSCIEVLGQVGGRKDLSNDGWSVKSASGRFGCDFKCVAFRDVFICDILNIILIWFALITYGITNDQWMFQDQKWDIQGF